MADMSSKSLGNMNKRQLGVKLRKSLIENSDRGTSGERSMKQADAKARAKYVSNRDLIDTYGKDAPRSRAFMSEDRSKKMANGGKIGTKAAAKKAKKK